jgi:hypothetical protein
MNIFIGSGKVLDTKFANNGKILKFVLSVAGKNKQDMIPCLVFNPPPEVKQLLSKEEQYVELHGKVQNFSFELAGEKVSRTEVVVSPHSISIMLSK